MVRQAIDTMDKAVQLRIRWNQIKEVEIDKVYAALHAFAGEVSRRGWLNKASREILALSIAFHEFGQLVVTPLLEYYTGKNSSVCNSSVKTLTSLGVLVPVSRADKPCRFYALNEKFYDMIRW
jgi:hypothetical protein